MNGFKDLFSSQALDYSKFRPHYPESLYAWLADQVPARKAAWDCGTGNGQAALGLAPFFERVFATDPSASQLSQASPVANVTYSVGTAESSGLAAQSVDLVTVAQAYHWFQHENFFKEVRRVARPGAVVAVWSYALAHLTPEIDAVVMKLYETILGPYWEGERRSVELGYRNLPFDFKRFEAPVFQMHASWSFEHLVGYLGTWSSLQTYLKKHGRDPRELVIEDLRRAWDLHGAEIIEVRWDLALHVGRVEA